VSTISILGRNIKFRVLSGLWGLIINFFLFPFIVRHTGQEIYGLYLMVLTFTGYFALLDMGVMSALTKYVSEFNGLGDKGAIIRVVNASFTFYVIIGIIVSLAMFVLSVYFDRYFHVKPENLKMVKELFIAAGFFSLASWPMNMFRGVLGGLNLWNYEAIVNMMVQFVNAVAAVALFSYGYGIVLYFIISQLLNMCGCVYFLFISTRKIRFRLIFPYLEKKTFSLIFKFSIFVFLASIVNVLLFQIHNLIIGYFLGLSAVTIYAVAYNIQNYFRFLNGAIGAPYWTMASEFEGRRDYDGQLNLLYKGTKYVSALIVPIIVIFFFFAEPFIINWMGTDFKDSVIPAKIIILFWIFNATLEPATGMLSAKGIVKEPLYIQSTIAIVNILIAICLVNMLGVVAIAIGLTLSMILVGAPAYLYLALKVLQIKFKDYYNKSIRKNAVMYILIAAISLGITTVWHPGCLVTTIGAMGCIYSISILFYYAVFLENGEKDEIKRIFGLRDMTRP